MPRLSVHGDQWIGMRENQEDAFAVFPISVSGADHCVGLIVADGMGGHAAGEEASRIVVEVLENAVLAGDGDHAQVLEHAVQQANRQLADAMSAQPDLLGMGTTVLAAIVDGTSLTWISVGDSLFCLIRDGRLYRLNADHSMAGAFESLIASGRMTEEEARTSPERHVLRSSVSGEDIPLIDIVSKDDFLRGGDVLLLASDGIDGLADDTVIAALTPGRREGAAVLVERLIDATRQMQDPSQDNTTVVACMLEKASLSGKIGGLFRRLFN